MFLQRTDNSPHNPNFQKQISRYLCSVGLTFNAGEFFSRQVGREWCDLCGPFVIQLCRYELESAPQCDIAAFLKTILNGWASTRRLGRQQDQCVFRCGSKRDCVEHYLECARVEEVWKRIFRAEWGPFECRLAVGSRTIGDRISRASSYMVFLQLTIF